MIISADSDEQECFEAASDESRRRIIISPTPVGSYKGPNVALHRSISTFGHRLQIGSWSRSLVTCLARVSLRDDTFWVVVDRRAQTLRRIDGDFRDWAPMLSGRGDNRTLALSGQKVPIGDVRFLPPVEKTNKIEVVGANYNKHLDELKLQAATQPVIFLKAYGALIGANDPIWHPKRTNQLDYEVELVVVVGSEIRESEDPMSSVLGFTVGNDVSARDLQMLGPREISMDLFGAKSQDRTCGVGPWIVTLDEFPDDQPDLGMRTRVNGETVQTGRTSEMTWSIAELLKFSNERSSLESGDVIFTGTPHGVGHSTGRYLQRGDRVEAEIDGIGTLCNQVV